jgi:hypothetical protein
MKRILAAALAVACLLWGQAAVAVPPGGGAQSTTGPNGLVASSATCTVAQSCLFVANAASDNIVTLGVSGTFNATVIVEGTADGINWNALTVFPFGSGVGQANITATGVYQVVTSGLINIRARVSVYVSGAVLITEQASSSSTTAGASSVTALFPLPGNANTAAGANQSGGIQAYDGTTNMVPLTETSNALDVNLKTQAGGLTVNSKISASATGGYTATALDFSAASTFQAIKGSAGTIYKFQWVCNTAMTNSVTVTLWDSASASGKTLGVYTFLAGGYDAWELPGAAFTIGLGASTSTTTAQSGCKFMAYFQ